ncbi:MAG: riboflavin biosynthesis protein RibF [Firmicutes bacterium]|nr:riboflavin biosynthesis protein RibF [Bacillota bacterium]
MNNALILGTFDGVHLGHRSLFAKGKELAGLGMTPVAVLFSRHPAQVLGKKTELINTLAERENLLRAEGVGFAYIDFNPELAAMPADDYVAMLCRRFAPGAMIAGRNHTFGRNAAGTPKDLLRLAGVYGYKVFVQPSVMYNGEPVSSTRIRECIRQGDMDAANAMLGYRFGFEGCVGQGRHVGSQMGFPTANIAYPEEKVCPADGVYCVAAVINGKSYGGVMNIGFRPTFENGGGRTYECNIFNYSGDLYGKTVRIEFIKRLREEKRFASPEELKKQISDDIRITTAYFKTIKNPPSVF